MAGFPNLAFSLPSQRLLLGFSMLSFNLQYGMFLDTREFCGNITVGLEYYRSCSLLAVPRYLKIEI